MVKRLIPLVIFILIGLSTPCYSQKQELTKEQKLLCQQSFDSVWVGIRDKHFDTTYSGNDWNAIRDEFRPKIDSAKTMNDVRKVLNEMLSRLKISHCGIIPKDTYEGLEGKKGQGKGVAGIEIRLIDSAIVVISVEPNSPAFAQGIRPGWVISKINEDYVSPIIENIAKAFEGSLAKELYQTRAVSSRLKGAIGDTLVITFLDGKNEEVSKTITLIEQTGKIVKLSNLPPLLLNTKIDTLDAGIGYFSFTVFLDPVFLMNTYDQIIKGFQESPGIIIDIRGNPGGIGMIGVGMSGSLIKETNKFLGTMIMRTTQLKFIVNPRTPSYFGPVAILIDGLSASTSEIFAGGLKDIGRARIFGTRSTGAALPAYIEALPDGDAFMHPMANYISFSGKALEGNGVIPDVEVPLTRAVLLEGRDPVLEAAIEWIKTQKNESK
jgi:carboxyl-terminal processing protease